MDVRDVPAAPSIDGGGDTVARLALRSGVGEARQPVRPSPDWRTFLAEASDSLLSSSGPEQCIQLTVRLAAGTFADAAVLVLPAHGPCLAVTACVAGLDAMTNRSVPADPAEVPGLSEALRGLPPGPSGWHDPGAVPRWAVPNGFPGPVGAVLVVPLIGHGVPVGALILLRLSGRPAFDEGDESRAGAFAARAGAALAAVRLHSDDARIAHALRTELTLPTLRRVHGVELAGGYQAAQPETSLCGDFYDLYLAGGPDAESLVVVGDVCGRGLDAAVFAAKIRTMVRALLPLADDHDRFLRLLNSALLASERARFVTMVLASVIASGANVRVRLTRAGHLPPLVVRAGGGVEEILAPGSLVGAFDKVHFATSTVELAPGDTCLLYTDGVTEALGGPVGSEVFGEERLHAALGECAGMPAEAVVERIMMLSAEWASKPLRDDDAAVVAITAPRSRI